MVLPDEFNQRMHNHYRVEANVYPPLLEVNEILLFGRSCSVSRPKLQILSETYFQKSAKITLSERLCDVEWVFISVIITAALLLLIYWFNHAIDTMTDWIHSLNRNSTKYFTYSDLHEKTQKNLPHRINHT